MAAQGRSSSALAHALEREARCRGVLNTKIDRMRGERPDCAVNVLGA